MMTSRAITAFLVGTLTILPVAWPRAQISPGELHRSHAFLEGVENCSRCHSPQGDQLADRCLECHTLIADQHRSGRGLHGRPEYRECVLCHVEHHGRDFDLVYFKDGIEAFDHSLTGYPLDGRHLGLACRKCHTGANVVDSIVRSAENISLQHTFLGLSRACAACHTDPHQNQFDQPCANCHTVSGWRPATAFTHDNARFPLLGKHQSVDCAKCHHLVETSSATGSMSYRQYRPVAHSKCTDCHHDPHANRLGPNCGGCHTLNDWRTVQTASFDHDRTRYPLDGRHSTVACDKCHGNRSASDALAFAACRDCHRDYHDGAFAQRMSRGACEECHTVEGFQPARFTIAQHDSTDFPLHGAHRAVPCTRCHRVEVPQVTNPYRFRFSSMTCSSCHKDPHRGQVDTYIAVGDCTVCHSDESWQDVHFDHSTTSFPLAGKHAVIGCTKCHLREGPPAVTAVRFAPVDDRCESCHADIHRGQFAAVGESRTDCARCHTPPAWRQLQFDHDRDSRFHLDGAHLRITCDKCHPVQTDPKGSYARYRPLDMQCAACHGTRPG